MAQARTVFLDQHEIDLIHAQSLESLRDIGIHVRSMPVLQMLGKSGASVDYTAMIAHIPEHMVNQALESVQRDFSLCARDPQRDLRVPTQGFLLESIEIPPGLTSPLLHDWETRLTPLIFSGRH